MAAASSDIRVAGVAGPAFPDFMDFEAAKAEFAANILESLAIALGQFPLRALLQPADGNDDEAHARAR